MSYSSKELKSGLWQDFQAFFEFNGRCSGCWCMNHRLPVGLDFEGEAAKLAMKELVQTNRVFGVLAYADNESIPVGWIALDRRKTLPGHDCIGENINCNANEWSIHCVTSRSDFKNKGVENYLVDEAIKLAKSLNAISIEAYPEPDSREDRAFKSWNTFNGYESHFLENGFKKQSGISTEVDEFFRVVKINC